MTHPDTQTVRAWLVAIAAAAVMGGLPDAGNPSLQAQLHAQVIRPARGSSSKRKSSSQIKRTHASRGDSEPSSHLKRLEDIWQVVSLDGQPIGYSRTTFDRLTTGGEVRLRTTTVMRLSVKRFGQQTHRFARTKTIETPSGELISFEAESGADGQTSRVTGRRKGSYLIVETTSGGRTSRRYHEWQKGTKSPTYQDRLLKTHPMKPGEIRHFKTFLPDVGRVTQVRLSAGSYRSHKLPDGRVHKLLKVRVTQSVSPTEVVYAYLDETGRPVLNESQFVGKTMRQYVVSPAEAIDALRQADFDLGLETVIRTTALRQAHQRDRIVYRIHMPGGDPARHLESDKRQRLRRLDKQTVELTVSRSKFPQRVVYAKTPPEYLSASKFLDSTDARVRQHARRAAGYQKDPIKIALRMERYVKGVITNKNFSTALATASQVARQLSGDCSEHAVLLAAMLRVRQIPSRIAIGLVYDERMAAFVAHMWTEARLGSTWVPLDATRGEGGIGPAHIKLADAGFADDSADPVTAFVPLINVLGQWRIAIRDAGEVRGIGNRPLRKPGDRLRLRR